MMETWALLGMLVCLGLGYALGWRARRQEVERPTVPAVTQNLPTGALVWCLVKSAGGEVRVSDRLLVMRPQDATLVRFYDFATCETVWKAEEPSPDAAAVERLLREL